MNTEPLDLTKPMKCRDGSVPIIYCNDAPGDYPIHGRLVGVYEPLAWNLMGRIKHFKNSERQWDLVNVPEPLVIGGGVK